MRLPNGFGQISEVRGRNLRKPFRAMVTAGRTDEGKPIVCPLRPVAYFETYNEAYEALMKYNAHPFDLIDKHPIIDMILIQCYSGWRPGELCDLKMKDVDMDVGTFTGGLKTKAGINRTVPIHPRIYNLVKARYEKALEAGSPYLFFTIRQRGFHHQNTVKGEVTQMRYASFSVQLVNEVVPLLSLNPEHKGHDGRITFVTMAKKYNMDEYAIKRLVGHHIKDLTERVYTQRSIDWLKNEIEKIP